MADDDLQVAVMESLVHGATTASLTKNWREAADEFLEALAVRGFSVVPSNAAPLTDDGLQAALAGVQDQVESIRATIKNRTV